MAFSASPEQRFRRKPICAARAPLTAPRISETVQPFPTMLTLRGSSALSPFRLEKLRADLVASGLPVRALAARFVHVAELAGSAGTLSAEQQTVLEKLLTYGPRRAENNVAVSGLVQVIAPRPGTISPWSSKATDIAHICGLAAVKRIERVVEFTVDIGSGGSLPDTQHSLLQQKLHDRMTQVVFDSLEACAALFSHATPSPMTSVPVLAQGRAALVEANTALGLAADLQLAAALPNVDLVEYIGGSPYVDGILETPFVLDSEGYLPIPESPGLGVRLSREKLARFTPDPGVLFA